MYNCVYTTNINGIKASLVKVEADILRGLPGFVIVGLPDTSVSESKERVKAALLNTGMKLPPGKITVNLSPAELKKNGSCFDLPIAVSLLAACGEIRPIDKRLIITGELGLDGSINPLKSILPVILTGIDNGIRDFIIPYDNRHEVFFLKNTNIYFAKNIKEIIDFFKGDTELERFSQKEKVSIKNTEYCPDLSEVCGQMAAKRSLEIAAAGNHNLLMLGSPGCGKTMLARRITGILPPLSEKESIETSLIHSSSGKFDLKNALFTERPFRAPHHTISNAALIGGGSNPKPGEVSLAHNGVLFLDELTEFQKNTIEVLRQPLSDKKVNISRAREATTFPANFMLVAAANPCPCGFLFDKKKYCTCSYQQREKYRQKLSGPLMDRFDLIIQMTRVSPDDLVANGTSEASSSVRERVLKARSIQKSRYKELDITTNSQLSPSQINQFCKLDKKRLNILKLAIDRFNMSARSYYKTLKLARTISDLEGEEKITEPSLLEAISYRKIEDWN